MIRTLLTHVIYECCIDVFFDRVVTNFSYTESEDYDNMTLIGRILGASRSIAMHSRRGGVNFFVCSPEVAKAIDTISSYN